MTIIILQGKVKFFTPVNGQDIDIVDPREVVGADSSVIPLDNIRITSVVYRTLLVILLDCHSCIQGTASKWYNVSLKWIPVNYCIRYIDLQG